MTKKFKDDFIFGVSTSSYQVEGAVDEDGRGPSIWDKFCMVPDKIYKGHTGDVACDHYHRYKEDIELMSEIGLDAYKFSISWSRIFPEKGKYNPAGMRFYKNLIAELGKKNIKPAVVLYHWDLPVWAYKMGGWLNRDSIKWFEEYAAKVFEELNDSVKFWVTNNEPFFSSILGYYEGILAPGHKDLKEALTVAHHILYSHGIVVENFRKYGFKNSKIGISLSLVPSYPASNSKEDAEAAFKSDGLFNRWFLDPIFKASYPEDMKKVFGKFVDDFDFIKDGDFEKTSTRIDFLGVDYFTHQLIKFSKDTKFNFKQASSDFEKTDMGCDIVPEALSDIIIRLREDYTQVPIYIAGNGAAFDDKISKDGKVHDFKRIDFIKRHLLEIAKLNEKGADIRGYFIWSLMDNFEWQYGYSERFGIVFIDYKTQERVLKDSAIWYKNLVDDRILE